MTDELAYQNCPKCGKENLAHMTHCVHCGATLEGLFSFDGQIDVPESDSSEDPILSLPFMFDEFDTPSQEDVDGEHDSSEAGDKPSAAELDWLERVRQRARAEEDATGELTKGIHSMQELVDESKNDAESQYQAWLDEVREKAEREKAKQAERLQPSPVDEDGVPEWLRRIRALHPKSEEDGESSDLDDEWTEEALEELRRRELGDDYVPPETEAEDAPPDEENPEEPSEDDTQEIEIEHNIPEDDDDLVSQTQPSDEALSEDTAFVIVGDPKLNPDEVFVTEDPEGDETKDGAQQDSKAKSKSESKTKKDEKEAILEDLVILHGQHEKVALLKSLISDEGKPVIGNNEPKPKKNDLSRLILGFIFIFVLLLSILFMPKTIGERSKLSAPQMWFGHYINNLERSDKVLIVMSYYSASAPELEALAAPVLAQFKQKAIDWHITTLRMDGMWQVQSLYDKAGIKNPNQHTFMPGGQFAMLDLAVKPDGFAQAGQQRPLPENAPNLGDYDLVLFVSDSALSLRGWLEQVAPNTEFILTLAIISQKEAAAIQPYFDSRQILGYLSGMQGLDGSVPGSGQYYRAYQAGLILMILTLILGLVLAFRKPQPQNAQQEERQ